MILCQIYFLKMFTAEQYFSSYVLSQSLSLVQQELKSVSPCLELRLACDVSNQQSKAELIPCGFQG